MAEKTQLEKLKVKIPYDERIFKSTANYEALLMNLLDDALNIALGNIYPFLDDYTGLELPSKYLNWQIRAAVELYRNGENQGYVSYSENGLSWGRKNDGALSNALLEELVPKAGTPKRSEV